MPPRDWTGRAEPYPPAVARARKLRALAVTCCVVLPLLAVGCGGGSDDSAERAEQISQSATDEHNEDVRRDLDRMREEQEQQAAAETVTAPQVAGSEEIDQPQDGAVDGTETTEVADSSATGALFSAADRKSFNKLAASTLGREGVAVATIRGTRLQSLGSLKSGVAWSTAKVPVAMAAIAAGTGNEADLRRAITASDNAAAERLWASLGTPRSAAAAATEQLRKSGDNRTTVQSQRLLSGYTAFGQTDWRLTDQARFVAGMSCTAQGRKVLGLMGQVTGGQRWGLGQAGTSQRFKGGWGPGVTPGSGQGWLERQMGIIIVGGRPVVVAIATDGPGHEADTVALTRIAKWVASHVDAKAVPRQPSC